jgi:hypothetical protein
MCAPGHVCVIVTGHGRGHPVSLPAVLGDVRIDALAHLGRRVHGIGIDPPRDHVHVQPIKDLQPLGIVPVGDPDRAVVGIDLRAKGSPLGHGKALLLPKKDHRTAAVTQKGRMLGVDADQMPQPVDQRIQSRHKRRSGLKIYGRLHALCLGGVEQRAKVAFGRIVARAVPRLYQGVDARATRFTDVSLHRGPIRGTIRREGHVGHLVVAPRMLIVPGVVKGQHQARLLRADLHMGRWKPEQ